MAQMTGLRGKGVPIGELSRRTGVNIETIRYYERVGMLSAPPRTRGGHRVYNADHIRTLSFIRRGRELGFSPEEVRALLDLGGPGKASCGEVREIAAHHLKRIRAKMADLARLEHLLAATIEQCTDDNAPECPVIDMLDEASGQCQSV